MKRRRKVLRYRSKLYIIILNIVFIISFIASCRGSDNERVKDVLHLNKKMEISITEVYYRKQETSKLEEDIEMDITIEQLKELFFERAVIVSGEMITHAFGYEPLVISGILKNNNLTYKFEYNIAGFGTIFITDKEYIEYGDLSKTIPEQ
jgi:hypothetical protein